MIVACSNPRGLLILMSVYHFYGTVISYIQSMLLLVCNAGPQQMLARVLASYPRTHVSRFCIMIRKVGRLLRHVKLPEVARDLYPFVFSMCETVAIAVSDLPHRSVNVRCTGT